MGIHAIKNEEVAIITSETEDKIQNERRESYIEPQIREILRKLLENEKENEIMPSYHPASGFTYNLRDSQKENGKTQYQRKFLENLVKLDILQRSFYDSVSACPKCGSPALTLHPSCPKCKSHNIHKTGLTEHIPCGYIDQREKYTHDLCPKCGKKLIASEYRNMGRWFVCSKCSERFEHPQFNLICPECNDTFSIEEARVLDVPKFMLNNKRRKEIRQNVASLENISKLLTELGFTVEMPGSIIGQKTEMEYNLSILAKKQSDNNEIVISVDHEVAEGEIQSQPIILYIYKISEMKVDIPIFMAVPKLSEAARKIAKGHDILLIEGSPQGQEKIDQIKVELEERIKKIGSTKPKPNEPIFETRNEITESLKAQSINPNSKKELTTLRDKIRKRKLASSINNSAEEAILSVNTSETNSKRNIVFLIDGSSSMTKKNGNSSNFTIAKEAIRKVLLNPDQTTRDLLSVIIFWDEGTIIKKFQKEILYEDLSMNKCSNLGKLSQFKPKKRVGTPIWDAVEYAINFLQNKRGQKVVKLITDAISIPTPKNGTIEKLENTSTQIDCIVIGSEGNAKLGKAINNYKLGRFIESSNLQSLVHALKA